MAGLIGADIERLRALASLFEEKADAVRSIEGAVSTACDELDRLWHGADAAGFAGDWQSRHRPHLRVAAEGLRDAATLLVDNADEQNVTSRSDDGVGLGAGRVADPGDGSGGGGRSRGGGGRLGFGLPILGDGWDVAREFASDTWDDATNLASDTWTDASDLASDTWDGITDTAGELWSSVTSTVGDVVDEGGHRLSEFGQYSGAYVNRWVDNPIQSAFDELTFTGSFERLVGSGAILILGGEYEENIANGDAEFITGLPIKFNDAITLGHSVLIDAENPRGGLIEHELQHVDDIEAVGGVGFYTSYLGNWIGNIIVGQDPSLGGEAYENIWWEQRADAAQDGNPPEDLDFGRFDPRNWFD